ncbi:hypothetical protein K438DRAFT_1778496 [Mycena galopus ATCC 62051]|nr:hypothetical protein K438DRAFT_1778496 [Mycena galopus ATCC 62051]
MQFFLVAFLALVSTSVSASPINPLCGRAGTCNANSTRLAMALDVPCAVHKLRKNAPACVSALAPSFPTDCNPAVAQQGANTALNAACLAAAAKGIAPVPTACTPCASQFGVTDPANNAATAKNNVNGTPAPATPASAKGAQNAAPMGPRASTLCHRARAVVPFLRARYRLAWSRQYFQRCVPYCRFKGYDRTTPGTDVAFLALGQPLGFELEPDDIVEEEHAESQFPYSSSLRQMERNPNQKSNP